MAATPSLRQDEPNLDFLRAVAVVAVLFAHTYGAVLGSEATIFGMDPWELGRIGVSLFFVHTSLVLFGSMARSERVGKLSFSDFYIRRFFRIYPLSVVCVLAVVLLGLPASPTRPDDLPRGALTVFSNLLLVQDFTNSDSVIGALWSLPIEVQMYVLLPFLYMVSRRVGSMSTGLALVLGLCVLAPLLALLPLPGLYRLTVLDWAPCFGAGFLAWAGLARTRRSLPGWLWPVALIATFLLFMPFGYEEYKQPARSWLMCIGVGLAIPYFNDLRSRWLVEPSRQIARYSYGIYLVHQSWLTIAFIWLAAWPTVSRWLVFCIGLVVTTLAGYHLIEEPGIRLGRRIAARQAGMKDFSPTAGASLT